MGPYRALHQDPWIHAPRGSKREFGIGADDRVSSAAGVSVTRSRRLLFAQCSSDPIGALGHCVSGEASVLLDPEATPERDDQQERRSRLLVHERSSLGRLALRSAGWRLTKRGSGPTTSETAS